MDCCSWHTHLCYPRMNPGLQSPAPLLPSRRGEKPLEELAAAGGCGWGGISRGLGWI